MSSVSFSNFTFLHFRPNSMNDTNNSSNGRFCESIGNFFCANQCIYARYVCDGVVDCKDGSDEHYDRCGKNPCARFGVCPNGRCAHKTLCNYDEIGSTLLPPHHNNNNHTPDRAKTGVALMTLSAIVMMVACMVLSRMCRKRAQTTRLHRLRQEIREINGPTTSETSARTTTVQLEYNSWPVSGQHEHRSTVVLMPSATTFHIQSNISNLPGSDLDFYAQPVPDNDLNNQQPPNYESLDLDPPPAYEEAVHSLAESGQTDRTRSRQEPEENRLETDTSS